MKTSSFSLRVMRRVSAINTFSSIISFPSENPLISYSRVNYRTLDKVHIYMIWLKTVCLEWNLIILMNEFVIDIATSLFSSNSTMKFEKRSQKICIKSNWRNVQRKNSDTLNRIKCFPNGFSTSQTIKYHIYIG